MSTVVIGTAGHIDHGKTSLLRALTGIDADRLPEERARGMTIDVGYAHLDLDDGTSLDFVDVPGHDRLVGNMLVGAGEIDAALLVVAADDGPRAQTFEHLELLDALEIQDGLAIVTKIDLVHPERAAAVVAEVEALLSRTSLAGAPILAASATTGQGIDELVDRLRALRDRVTTRALTRPAGPLRLAIDRAFAVRGRGVVVTGTLRGSSLATGDHLRLEPGGASGRVRELQVHNVKRASHDGGRTALNLAGVEAAQLRRGLVLTQGAGIEASDRVLVALRPRSASGPGRPLDRWPPADGANVRLHIGTEHVAAIVGRRGRDAAPLPDGSMSALLRLDAPVATFVGDRGILRGSSPETAAVGVRVLDPRPPRGVSRRRQSPERLGDLAVGIGASDPDATADALVGLHGAVPAGRIDAVAASLGPPRAGHESRQPESPATGSLVLSVDISDALERQAQRLVADHHRAVPDDPGLPLADLRAALLIAMRRAVSVDRSMATEAAQAVDRVIVDLVARGRLARDGDRVRDPAHAEGVGTDLAAAMNRLEELLSVAGPPPLAEAALAADCSEAGIRALVAQGRILRLEADLAWSTPTYHRLAATALGLARRGPLTPATFRDATGTSRKYVLAILEDLDRRGILVRTPEGHIPGPKAPAVAPDAATRATTEPVT